MKGSFWVQGYTRRITVSDQQAGVMVEIDVRDPKLGGPAPDSDIRQEALICLSKGEARAIASVLMGAAAEL